MTRLSRERIRQELMKLLVASRAVETTRLMHGIGLWPLLHIRDPQLDRLAWLAGYETRRSRTPAAILCLAALASDQEDPERLQEALALSNAETKRLAAARTCARIVTADRLTDFDLRRLAYSAGSEGLEDAILLAGAAAQSDSALIDSLLERAKPLTAAPPVNPFNGVAAAARGVPAGPRMGRVLAMATNLWLAEGCPADPATHARLLDQAIAGATD
jgi:poly(A) polymerase